MTIPLNVLRCITATISSSRNLSQLQSTSFTLYILPQIMLTRFPVLPFNHRVADSFLHNVLFKLKVRLFAVNKEAVV